MPKALSMLDALTDLANPDALTYLVDAAVEPVERKVKLSDLAAFTQRYARQVIILTGSTEQTLDTSDVPTALVLVTGTVPSVVIGGTPRINSEFTIVNGTEAAINVTSTTGFIGMPTTAVSPVVLGPGDVLRVTRVDSDPDVWVGELCLGKASTDASRTIVESNTPDATPQAIWASSGEQKALRTIELPPGTWLVDAHVVARAPNGGTYLSGQAFWADHESVFPAGYGAGYWGGSASLLLGMSVPVRKVTVTTPTTLTLNAALRYAGGTGDVVAWVTITARRVF